MASTYDLVEMAKTLGVSRTTIYKLRRLGKLLDPLQFSPDTSPRWSSDEVRRWLEAGAPDAKTWRERNARPAEMR
jgi:predicted DNA-binding transcriptional regulator AlpA